VKVEVGLQFEITFLTQHLGLPMIWVKTTQHQVTLSVKFHNYGYFRKKIILTYLM